MSGTAGIRSRRASAWSALALVAALLAPGCGRRDTPAPAPAPAPADTTVVLDDAQQAVADRERAARMRSLVLPHLSFWLGRWAAVDSSVGNADSLRLVSVEDLPLAPAVPFHRDSVRDRRSLRLFGVTSPDGRRAAIADFYRDAWMQGRTLAIGFGDEPDSWAVVVDLTRDSVITLARVGTLGMYEEARWIDSERLIVTYSGEDPDDPSARFGQVGVFDLADGAVVWFRLPDVGPDGLDEYRRLLYDDERRRLTPLMRS